MATFPVFLNTDVTDEAVAEIVAATKDGRTLVYTDSGGDRVGFVDIGDPSHPQPAGVVGVGGSPTSVVVHDKLALVCVDTSPSFTAPSGVLQVIDVATHQIVRSIDLGGQPDCIALNKNARFAVIAIENQRDEDLGDGHPPQLPAGFVVIVDLKGNPAQWTLRAVDVTGLADLYPTDPEPEYVDINENDIAAVTLQENNHIVLIDVKRAQVVGDFSAGSVDLSEIDVVEDELITLNGALDQLLREPDGITWLSADLLATADEGDLDGGSRGFTIFDKQGHIVFRSQNEVERLAVRVGHYPDDRSENKGSEPENIKFAKYGSRELLFVASERSSVIAVYQLDNHGGPHDLRPTFVQVLPAGFGPEGVLAIPGRNLLVAASENDSRDDGFRGTLTIYELQQHDATYPTIESADRADGTPISWGALSTLAADPHDRLLVYTAYDNAYRKSRILTVDVSARPAVIFGEIVLHDPSDLLVDLQDDAADKTLDLDVEGVAVAAGGGFWVVSEGGANAATLPNFLLEVSANGDLLQVVRLPASLEAFQTSSGFEGVAAVATGGGDELVYVAIQREWGDDPTTPVRMVKIGRYDTANGEWRFFHYPLDPAESPNGGVVGLSELVAIDAESFAVIERDNQAGTDARIKRIERFSVAGVTPELHGNPLPVLQKALVRDLIPDLATQSGAILEKIEGLTILASGRVLVLSDNDGVSDHTGETQLLRLGRIFGN